MGSPFTLVTSTCAGASVSAAGVATYNVPASGSCAVNYQVCAPAPNGTQCDTATLTVTAFAISADEKSALVGNSSGWVAVFDTKSGEVVEYLLPRTTNIRRVFIDNAVTPIAFWVGSTHGASIVKLEPLD